MAEAKAAWDEVGNRFSDLAGKVKEQFDARAAYGAPDSQKVDDAVRTLVRALDNAFTAIGDTLRDPATRDDVKQAANAMGDALATTFRDVADQIKSRTGRDTGGGAGGGDQSDDSGDSGGGYATPG
jgi:hypothetical protein